MAPLNTESLASTNTTTDGTASLATPHVDVTLELTQTRPPTIIRYQHQKEIETETD